ncbi:MAG: hypothetical protein RPU52_00445 [Candidatus Sedimenticola sp. (ex Thyasira tokunagai)]
MAINKRVALLLKRIELGEPVNMHTLAKQLLGSGEHHLSEIEQVFGYASDSNTAQVVEVKDVAGFDMLRQQYPSDAMNNRTSAALAGDSHRKGVSGCFAIIDHVLTDKPMVCTVKEGQCIFPRGFGKDLVVIENEELLIQKPHLATLLIEHCNIPEIETVDVMLGGGNRLASQHLRAVYRHYQKVYFLLDLDLGGLKAFKSVLSLIDSPTLAHFLLPRDIERYLQRYTQDHGHGRKRLTAAQRQKLERYLGIHPDTDRAIELIANYQCMPEQEIYLALMEKENS